jgi:hypothetical protein
MDTGYYFTIKSEEDVDWLSTHCRYLYDKNIIRYACVKSTCDSSCFNSVALLIFWNFLEVTEVKKVIGNGLVSVECNPWRCRNNFIYDTNIRIRVIGSYIDLKYIREVYSGMVKSSCDSTARFHIQRIVEVFKTLLECNTVVQKLITILNLIGISNKLNYVEIGTKIAIELEIPANTIGSVSVMNLSRKLLDELHLLPFSNDTVPLIDPAFVTVGLIDMVY